MGGQNGRIEWVVHDHRNQGPTTEPESAKRPASVNLAALDPPALDRNAVPLRPADGRYPVSRRIGRLWQILRLGRRRCFRPLPRVHQAADEEDDSGARVADQEDERVIGAENNGFLRAAHGGGGHGGARGGGGFGPLL